MKWFFALCLLTAGVGITVASCGPQKDFCPTSNPDPADLTCHANLDAATGMGGMMGTKCDGGTQMLCSDQKTIVCNLADCP